MRTNTDHRLDGKTHARLRLSNRLVLGIVRNIGRAMEELIDAVTAVCPDDAAVFALCVLLDNVAILAEECARLDDVDSLR